jgi:hypothetical protein
MKASPEFAKRKITKSTKNLKRAVIAVQSFLFQLLFNKKKLTQSVFDLLV